MEENKRQKQVGKLVMEELSDIFQREGMNIIDGGMISITKVMVTPDLLEGRVYLSFFQVKNQAEMLHKIKERSKEWRKLLGNRIKNQLRRIPELEFYNDDTLDHLFKMEELFKKIAQERPTTSGPETDTTE
jgi:ribosome-binding factor A